MSHNEQISWKYTIMKLKSGLERSRIPISIKYCTGNMCILFTNSILLINETRPLKFQYHEVNTECKYVLTFIFYIIFCCF